MQDAGVPVVLRSQGDASGRKNEVSADGPSATLGSVVSRVLASVEISISKVEANSYSASGRGPASSPR